MKAITTNMKPSAHILVIDDEEIVHASLKRILERLGHTVTGVFSAENGLDLIERERFDLVMVDLMMPKMNGIQFLQSLAKNFHRIPVIMITGYPTIGTAVKALRLGAVDYVAKPFTRKEITSPVQRALAVDVDTISIPDIGEHTISKDDLVPNDVVVLPRHSWAKFMQDGTFQVGIECSFMQSCENITEVSLPDEMDLVEQGYIGLYVAMQNGEEHGVAMPLSGQVLSINQEVMENPAQIDDTQWLIRIIPSHLEEELKRLVKRT
ncbi:MAG: response regulator [Proteobacteria bacterium]|nr:response regulator [Pseudomonadota bacterium]